MTDTPPKKPRGLAAMTPERRAEIARLGGAAGRNNPNRPWARDPSKASDAGVKGGKISRRTLTRSQETTE